MSPDLFLDPLRQALAERGITPEIVAGAALALAALLARRLLTTGWRATSAVARWLRKAKPGPLAQAILDALDDSGVRLEESPANGDRLVCKRCSLSLTSGKVQQVLVKINDKPLPVSDFTAREHKLMHRKGVAVRDAIRERRRQERVAGLVAELAGQAGAKDAAADDADVEVVIDGKCIGALPPPGQKWSCCAAG